MTQVQDTGKATYVWGVLRIALGVIFLWAFSDKFFGLGFSTCRDKLGEVAMGCEKAVLGGGSPTEGFLKFGSTGPFADLYHSLAGSGFVDALYMIGLAGIGLALILGIGMRIATVAGILFLGLIYLAALWPENNPIIDEHIVYGITLVGLLLVNDQQKLGLGSWWAKTSLVKTIPLFK